MAIDATSNVEELIDRYPSTARVFVSRRMACVGCEVARFETVADVCEIYRQPLDAMLRELRAATMETGGSGEGRRRGSLSRE